MLSKSLSLLLLVPALFFSQGADQKFIDHLKENHLQAEHQAYLNELDAGREQHYYLAAYYIKYFNDSLFFQHFEKTAPEFLNNKNIVSETDKTILVRGSDISKQRWFEHAQRPAAAHKFYQLYKVSEDPTSVNISEVPEGLRTSYTKYRRAFKRSPGLAALMSAIVPGSGKLYAGKPGSALLGLSLNAIYGLQTIESAQKLGRRHVFTWVNAAGFVLFYAANIYGSYESVKKIKMERKKQFVQDALFYYE